MPQLHIDDILDKICIMQNVYFENNNTINRNIKISNIYTQIRKFYDIICLILFPILDQTQRILEFVIAYKGWLALTFSSHGYTIKVNSCNRQNNHPELLITSTVWVRNGHNLSAYPVETDTGSQHFRWYALFDPIHNPDTHARIPAIIFIIL